MISGISNRKANPALSLSLASNLHNTGRLSGTYIRRKKGKRKEIKMERRKFNQVRVRMCEREREKEDCWRSHCKGNLPLRLAFVE